MVRIAPWTRCLLPDGHVTHINSLSLHVTLSGRFGHEPILQIRKLRWMEVATSTKVTALAMRWGWDSSN